VISFGSGALYLIKREKIGPGCWRLRRLKLRELKEVSLSFKARGFRLKPIDWKPWEVSLVASGGIGYARGTR
jgi:hypothetical protein